MTRWPFALLLVVASVARAESLDGTCAVKKQEGVFSATKECLTDLSTQHKLGDYRSVMAYENGVHTGWTLLAKKAKKAEPAPAPAEPPAAPATP